MNKEQITRTAICYWSEQDQAYIVQSTTSFPPICAAEDTEEEAWNLFNTFLNEAYEAWRTGNLAGYDKPCGDNTFKRERMFDIMLDSESYIFKLAKQLDCTLGDAVDYLVLYHKLGILPTRPANDSPASISQDKS